MGTDVTYNIFSTTHEWGLKKTKWKVYLFSQRNGILYMVLIEFYNHPVDSNKFGYLGGTKLKYKC